MAEAKEWPWGPLQYHRGIKESLCQGEQRLFWLWQQSSIFLHQLLRHPQRVLPLFQL